MSRISIDTIEAEFHFLGKDPFHILLKINGNIILFVL